jgi:hypothetical protein
MKNERTYCKSCCSPQRTIRDRAGLRCSACERLLVPLQHRRHRPVKNASHSRVKEFSAALRESLDRQPLARRDYLLTPNGGRFQIEQGSIADRFIREQEVA